MKTKIIELIYTEERKGNGKENDPVHLCPQLWTKDGKLVAERDQCPMGVCDEPFIQFFPESLNLE